MEVVDYSYFIDREKGKPCLVAGNAPTIKNFPFDKFEGVYFFMNFGPLLFKRFALPNYWLSANYQFPVPTLHYKKLNTFKDTTFLFSDSAIYCHKYKYSHEEINRKLKINWFAFDDRHFQHKKCSPEKPCCSLVDIYTQRLTIHEYIQQHYLMPTRCPTGNTGALFSLMFAILAGCSPIYLQGIELPIYGTKYFQYNILHPASSVSLFYLVRSYWRQWINKKPEYSAFNVDFEQTLDAFGYMAGLCKKLGIEIYNLSPTSALNKVKNLPYLDYKKVKTC